MKISVITAVFNDEGHIEGCIRSVLGQGYNNLEYIVVDGGSNDKTPEIVSRYSGRVVKISSSGPSGLYTSLNRGISAAAGQVIGFLHSDDLYAAGDVLESVARIFSDKGADCVYGDLEYVDRRDTSKVIRYWRAGECRPEKLRRGWFPPHPALFIKKDIYDKYGLFDASFRIAADYDLMLRFLLDKGIKACYLPKVLIKMRAGGMSNRSLRCLLKKSYEDFVILKKHKIRFPLLVLLNKNISKIPQFFNLKKKQGVL